MNFNAFIVNWKTTVLGLAAASLNALANGTKPAQVGISVAFALLGILAKDNNVTGGSVNQ